MPDYDFRSLSPLDFEIFARDLLNADLGRQLVSFGAGPDGGIDLRESRDGWTVIAQCKHRPDAKKRELLAQAALEAARWQVDEVQEYLFVVSSPVTPDAEVEIRQALAPLPAGPSSIWHRDALNAALARNPNIEASHFKLWLSSAQALERISAAAQWQRSEELLQRVSDRVRLYVHTPQYSEALETLNSEHLVLISGGPGVGKSTLAEMLLLSLWHEGWTVVNIASDIDEAWRQIRSSEQRVVFYYDDFLGQSSIAELQKNEASGIALLMERLRNGDGTRLLVLTSREQVLGQATHGDDDRVRRLIDDHSKLRIEMTEIDRSARARMLFNHLHFGFDDPSVRGELSSNTRYREVVDHAGFNPRILESVVLTQKHRTADDLYDSLIYALEHPDSIWAGSFQQLSSTAVQILLQLAVWPSYAMDLETLRQVVGPADPRDWTLALKVLENTWIRLMPSIGRVEEVALFDPSRRDFLLDLLDDESYIDAILDSLTSVRQLNYLLRLSGLLVDALDANLSGDRKRVRGSILRRWIDLDAIAAMVGRNELERAAGSEATLALRTELARATSLPNVPFTYQAETLSDRLDILISLASLCFLSDVPAPKTTDLLLEQMKYFDTSLGPRIQPRPSQLFALAARLSMEDAPEWAISYASVLAELGFDFTTDTDDIRSYSVIPQWFRDGPFHQVGLSRMTEVLELELDGIGQQDDRDLMSQWLDDVVEIAQEHDIDLRVDSLRESIYEMKPKEVRSAPRVRPIEEDPQEAGTDEDLALLFAKLK